MASFVLPVHPLNAKHSSLRARNNKFQPTLEYGLKIRLSVRWFNGRLFKEALIQCVARGVAGEGMRGQFPFGHLCCFSTNSMSVIVPVSDKNVIISIITVSLYFWNSFKAKGQNKKNASKILPYTSHVPVSRNRVSPRTREPGDKPFCTMILSAHRVKLHPGG